MKNEFKFIGEVVEIFPIQTINSADGSKSWQKQEVFVTEFDEQYPQKATFEVFGADKIPAIFDQLSVGDRGTFFINLKGSNFDKKTGGRGGSSSIQIWKFEKQTATVAAPAYVAPPFSSDPAIVPPPAGESDLPF